ncbi:DUF4397 domain-containing protein [Deinococcus pimensis]|uniref:DUF4397 domain-containing protein n=1 Tax=Deinococcus pimensis TaxID=309888 RepID=UPI0004B7DD2C|nr:DUF4397 domain-containing protein [Deinococcus pimensis]
MRHLKTLLAALTATAAVSFAATASAAPLDQAQLYFASDTGAAGLVDVYVDGQLVFDDIFSGSPTMFAQTLTSGEHTIVITPADAALGQRDLLSDTINVASGMTYTLNLAQDNGSSASGDLYVSLDAGAPTGE